MNYNIFLVFLFFPFFYSLYLIYKRINLSVVNKKITKFGLIVSVVFSLISSIFLEIFSHDTTNVFLIFANIIFLSLNIFVYLFFKKKKKFMFAYLGYNTFLSLLISVTYVFILSKNLVISLLSWILSGVLIYIYSYFDVFKKGSDNNPNRFYYIFLIGDFTFLLSSFLLLKYAIISDNYSYMLNFSDIKLISSYILGNSDFEYIILPIFFAITLFSRSFIFPFASAFSFMMNSSNIFYLTVFVIFSPLYALVLFLKLNLFENVHPYFKIYLLIAIIFILISLLFEKYYKTILGYLLSMTGAVFVLIYFENDKAAVSLITILYIMLFSIAYWLLLSDKNSFAKKIVNKDIGFIQERTIISLFESIPLRISNVANFAFKSTFVCVFSFINYLIKVASYHYMLFIQNRKISSVLKGIFILYTVFALLAIFVTLFGKFGEM